MRAILERVVGLARAVWPVWLDRSAHLRDLRAAAGAVAVENGPHPYAMTNDHRRSSEVLVLVRPSSRTGRGRRGERTRSSTPTGTSRATSWNRPPTSSRSVARCSRAPTSARRLHRCPCRGRRSHPAASSDPARSAARSQAGGDHDGAVTTGCRPTPAEPRATRRRSGVGRTRRARGAAPEERPRSWTQRLPPRARHRPRRSGTVLGREIAPAVTTLT